MTTTLQCHEARHMVLPARDGELPPAERAAWRQHLASCQHCTEFARRLEDTLDAAASLPDTAWSGPTSDNDLFARISRAIDTDTGHSHPTLPWDADLHVGDDPWPATDALPTSPEPSTNANPDDLFARISLAIDADVQPSAPLPQPSAPASVAAGTVPPHTTSQPANANTAPTRLLPDGRQHLPTPANVQPISTRPTPTATRRWAGAATALAASILLAWIVPGWLQSPPVDRPASPPDTIAAESSAAPVPNVPPPAAHAETSATTSLDAVAQVPEVQEHTRVFAEPDARWQLSPGSPAVLTLDEGGVLIEFLGDPDQGLRVEVGSWTVDVVGTIFHVRAGEQPEVRVLDGAVSVNTADGRATMLTDGEMLAASSVTPLPEADRRAMNARANVATHRAELAARRAESPEGAGPPPALPPSPTAPQDSPTGAERVGPGDPGQQARADARGARSDNGARADSRARTRTRDREPVAEVALDEGSESSESAAGAADPNALAGTSPRERARRAHANRDWGEAVRHYEAWLGDEPDAAEARLDLARIWIRQLNQPGRAVEHLEAFLRSHPDDLAAPAVRAELCRLVDGLGRTSGECP